MNIFNIKPVSKEKNKIINCNNLPPDLFDTFLLINSSNPYLKNVNNHLFDGDGMIHVFHFKKNNIFYHNRWIKTYRFNLEKKYNKPLFVRLANLNTLELFTKFFNKLFLFEDVTSQNGDGTANTNILYHHGNLFALNEMDKPYLLRFNKKFKLQTVSRYDFHGDLKHNINAHPKIDPDTNNLYTLGYDVFKKMCFVSVVNKIGKITKTTPIPLTKSTIIHDFCITKNKILILDLSLQFSLKNVILSNFPIGVDNNSLSRIGILDKYSNSLLWIPFLYNYVIFHIANSWEEQNGQYIIIYAFCYESTTFDIQHLELQRPQLKKIILNIHDCSCTLENVSQLFGEFPIIDDNYVSKPIDFLFYSKISDFGFDAIVKHNTNDNSELIKYFPKNMYGSECAIYKDYLINIVFYTIDKKSKLLIYNKHSLDLLYIIDLKCRIPFGFHCKIFKF